MAAALAGKSGVRQNEGFTEAFGVKICGNVVDFDKRLYEPKEARRMDSFIQLV